MWLLYTSETFVLVVLPVAVGLLSVLFSLPLPSLCFSLPPSSLPLSLSLPPLRENVRNKPRNAYYVVSPPRVLFGSGSPRIPRKGTCAFPDYTISVYALLPCIPDSSDRFVARVPRSFVPLARVELNQWTQTFQRARTVVYRSRSSDR